MSEQSSPVESSEGSIARIARSIAPAFALAVLTSLIVPSPAIADGAVATDTAAPAASSPPAGVASEAQETRSPRAIVEAFHAGLLDIMKRASSLDYRGRIEALAPLMQSTFDLDFMASRTVGRHWRKLSDADQQRWIELFARLSTANYAGRFTGFKGEQFVTLGIEDAARDTRMVLTKIIVPNDDDVELNYRLMATDGQWKVVDVYLNGTVSELALRRSEYASALDREGFEELVAAVESKIQDLETKARADG